MKYLKICLLLTLSFLITKSQAAETTEYLYHPNTKMALGRGFEPNILAEPKLNCVEFTPKKDISTGGATSTVFFMTVVSNSSELKKVLGIDFSLDARQLNSSVNAGFNLNNESLFNSNSISIVITALSEFGTSSMENPKLTTYAQEMITNMHHDQFREQCGSHLVVQEVLGVRAAIVITIDNLKSSTVNEIKSSAGFQYNAGSMDFKMQLKLNNLLKNSSEMGSIRINIFATGSKGVEDLDGIVKNIDTSSEGLSKIKSELGDYLKKFPADKAVPIRFYTKGFPFGFQNKYENIWKSHYERKIQRIAEIYRKVAHEVETAKNIFNGTDIRSLVLTSNERSELLNNAYNAEAFLDELVELHRDCQFNVYKQLETSNPNTSGGSQVKHCAFNEANVPKLAIPEMPEVPTLLAHSETSTNKERDLEVFASAIESVEIYYNNKSIQIFKFPSPQTVIPQTYSINLDRYWGMRKSHVKGSLIGRVVIKDYYGRITLYRFHYTEYSENGSPLPYIDLFNRVGLE